MARKSASASRYYYASGKKVELAPADDLIAVDERALAAPSLPKWVRTTIRENFRPLSSGVGLIHRADLGSQAAEIIRALRRPGQRTLFFDRTTRSLLFCRRSE